MARNAKEFWHMKKVTVLGEGAFGTAIAQLLADNGSSVVVWCHDAAVADEISHMHTNERYLPGIALHKHIEPTTDLAHAFAHSDFIFEAIPVAYLRGVLERAKPFYRADQTLIILSKGIEQKSGALPSQLVDDIFGNNCPKAVMVGPSFAAEVARKQLSVLALAATDNERAQQVKQLVVNSYFKTVYTADMIGIQVAGALKNVVAIALGILDGAGYGENARAFFITQGLREISLLINHFGGRKETAYGLAGIGDLMLTACSTTSKNFSAGKKIGEQGVRNFFEHQKLLPEGFNTIETVWEMVKREGIDLPLSSALYQTIFGNNSIKEMVDAVLEKTT